MSLQSAIELVRERFVFPHDLKPEQDTSISALIAGKNVFCLLPTGFGKSDIFLLPPLILNELDPETGPHIAITVCPLKSLCHAHRTQAESKGIQSAVIEKLEDMDKAVIKGIKEGKYTHIFASPEAFTENRMWREMLSTEIYRKKLSLFTFDEVHCMSEWGNDFRPSYKAVASIRSHLYCPVLMTTATMTESMKKDIMEMLHFEPDDVQVVAVLPDRSNIFLNYKSQSGMTLESELGWLADELREKGTNARKFIVYVRSLRKCADVWEFLTGNLDAELFDDVPLVEMFHSSLDPVTSKSVLEEFCSDGSKTKCIVSTIAFGMGIHVNDVDVIVHWGASKSILNLWQEIGRCGRDGRKGHSYMYIYLQSLHPKLTDECMRKLCKDLKSNDNCVRSLILKNFMLAEMSGGVLPDNQNPVCSSDCTNGCECSLCRCCSFCQMKCSCKCQSET